MTEVGLVLWDTDLRAPVKLFGTLVKPGDYAVWEGATEHTLAAVDVNGITPEICAKYGMEDSKALQYVLSWYGSADVACAHNGNNFDKPLLEAWAARYGLDPQKGKLWLDTRSDIERPPKYSHRLGYMAADHGFLNPFPHRAMFDVMTMLTILMAPDISKAPPRYDLDTIQAIAKSPLRVLKALVSFDNNHLAKARGYHARYRDGKFQAWELETKDCFLERERETARKAGFEVEVIR